MADFYQELVVHATAMDDPPVEVWLQELARDSHMSREFKLCEIHWENLSENEQDDLLVLLGFNEKRREIQIRVPNLLLIDYRNCFKQAELWLRSEHRRW